MLKKKTKKIPKISLGLLISLFFSACSLSPNPESSNPPPLTQNFLVLTASESTSLTPLSLQPHQRTRLINIYEGLIELNHNFKPLPSLAYSWGQIDENTWEFNLRPNVLFHNDQPLTTPDIIYSFNQARNNPTSELIELLSSIENITTPSPQTIQIKTHQPDPLLLQKISQVLIIPENTDPSSLPPGTGPYTIQGHNPTSLKLNSFPSYWGTPPHIQTATFLTISPELSSQAFKSKNCPSLFPSEPTNSLCGIITDIPYRHLTDESQTFTFYNFSKLETTYLAYNYNSPNFPNPALQDHLLQNLSTQNLSQKMGTLYTPATQFIPSGSFGHNPEISSPQTETQPFKAPESLTLAHLPQDEKLATYLKKTWEESNLKIQTKSLPLESLITQTTSGQTDLVLLTWQTSFGDTGEFFSQVIHTSSENFGKYNWFNYSNPTLDSLIEKAAKTLSWKPRLKLLRESSTQTLSDPPFGIPLIQSHRTYLLNSSFSFTPRTDGYLNLKKIIPKTP